MSKKRWHVRKFVDEDFEKVSRLRKLFFEHAEEASRRSYEPDYYRWKIESNPVQRGILHVADDAGRVVGMVSITPKPLYINGELTDGAELGDGFISPEYQRQGMFSVLLNETREEAIEKALDFIYGTPNEQALPGERKAGYEVIPGTQLYNLVRPLNMGAVLRAKINSSMLAKILGPWLHLGFKMFYRVKSPQLEKQGVKFSLVSSFPEDINALWEKVVGNYDWIVERSKKYLDWRFVQNPDTYSIMLARNSRNTIGYIVTKIGYWQNLKVGFLADFLVGEKSPEVFTELVLRSLKNFQQVRVDMVAGWAVDKGIYYNVLRRFGFKRHKEVPIICYKTDLCAKIINQPGKWHFTMADSDNI